MGVSRLLFILKAKEGTLGFELARHMHGDGLFKTLLDFSRPHVVTELAVGMTYHLFSAEPGCKPVAISVQG